MTMARMTFLSFRALKQVLSPTMKLLFSMNGATRFSEPIHIKMTGTALTKAILCRTVLTATCLLVVRKPSRSKVSFLSFGDARDYSRKSESSDGRFKTLTEISVPAVSMSGKPGFYKGDF